MKGALMDDEKLEKLDDLTLSINLDLNILNSALKDDYGNLEMCLVSQFVERIYQNSDEVRKLF